MLQVSRQVDYGLQFLLALAALDTESCLSVRQFAEARNMSFLFLQKIARQLKQAELIEARKGARGGYVLAIPAQDITLKKIIDAIEGQYQTIECLNKQAENCDCPSRQTCVSQAVFRSLQKDIITTLGNYNLPQMQLLNK